MIVSLFAAASENDVIGKDNWLPWDLPDELANFRSMTRGKPVIMGRKTHESIGRALPGRHNIVISRDPAYKALEGCDAVQSMEEALALAVNDNAPEVCILGGSQIYAAALPYAERFYLTRVHATLDGDTTLPHIDWGQWKKTEAVDHPVDDKHAYAFTMEVWEKKQ